MGYFDDFRLLNVTKVRMYGAPEEIPSIVTACHYLGLIQGKVLIGGEVVEYPFIYLTPAGIAVEAGWTSPPGAWRDNFYLEFTGSRADRFMEAFGSRDHAVEMRVENPAVYLEIFEEIKRLFSLGNPNVFPQIVLKFEELAALLCDEQNSRKNPRRFDRLMRDISKEPEKKWDFAAEAAKAGITMRHWNRLFTAAAGMPPHRFVISCRLRKARELLTSTSLSIKEISVLCGFESPSEFSRFFRKHTRTTAGACRKNRFL